MSAAAASSAARCSWLLSRSAASLRLEMSCLGERPAIPSSSLSPPRAVWRSKYAIDGVREAGGSTSTVIEAIDDDLGSDQTEAHRQDDRDGGHAVRERRRQELQGGIRAAGEHHQATRHSEEKDARDHRYDRRKAARCERHVPATSDGSEDQPDHEACHERADRGAETDGECPPPQRMSDDADRDRP